MTRRGGQAGGGGRSAAEEARRDEVVALWDGRARAYAALSRRYSIFGRIADRLIDEALAAEGSVPAGREPLHVDLASGAGLVAERLLARVPAARVVCVEPAPAMLALARERLGERAAGFRALPAERAGELELEADTFLCSASMHLCDERQVFRGVAARLAPGGRFAFNLWWHAFDETAERGPGDLWRDALLAAFAERGHPPPELPEPRPVRVRTRDGLARDAAEHGLELERCTVDEDLEPHVYQAAFATMGIPTWGALPADERAALLERTRELCPGSFLARTVRVVLRRPRLRTRPPGAGA